ncbi:MAG: hypothetical protein K6C40_11400 [Thermoguttaceae bacterium]|nr:hypothetical protein [Thermoguttaceae bacterium]
MKVSWNLLSRKKFDRLLIQEKLYAGFQIFQEKNLKNEKKREKFCENGEKIKGTYKRATGAFNSECGMRNAELTLRVTRRSERV